MAVENIKNRAVRKRENNKGNDIIWIFIFSILVIIAQIGDAMNSDFIQWFCSLTALVLFLFCKKKEEMPFLLFVIFSTKSLSILGVSCALLMAVVSVFKESLFRSNKLKNKEICFLVVFLFFGAILIVEDRSSDLILLIKYWFTIIFIIKTFDGKNDRLWYERSLKYMFFGFSITILGSMLFNRTLLNETRYMISSETGANMTAIFCGWILSYSVIMLLDGKINKSMKKYAIISFMVALIAGILTASRTFLLIVAVSIVIIFIMSLSKRKHFLRNIFIFFLILVLCVMLIIFNDTINQEFTYLMRRVTNPRGNDISGGRIDIWKVYWQAISANAKNVVIGFKPSDYGIMEMAHNAIIEQFVQYGVLGNSIIVTFCCYAVKEMNKYLICIKNHAYLISEQNMHFLPGVAILVSGMVSHSFMALPKTIFIFFSLYLYLSYKWRNRCKAEEKEN